MNAFSSRTLLRASHCFPSSHSTKIRRFLDGQTSGRMDTENPFKKNITDLHKPTQFEQTCEIFAKLELDNYITSLYLNGCIRDTPNKQCTNTQYVMTHSSPQSSQGSGVMLTDHTCARQPTASPVQKLQYTHTAVSMAQRPKAF